MIKVRVQLSDMAGKVVRTSETAEAHVTWAEDEPDLEIFTDNLGAVPEYLYRSLLVSVKDLESALKAGRRKKKNNA